jgi:hypothetical protein
MSATPLRRVVRCGTSAGILAACFGLMTPCTSLAQGLFRGRVVDSETGHAIARARVQIAGDSLPYTTDDQGLFQARGPAGTRAELTVDALGYARGTFHEQFARGDTLRILALDFTGYKLPEVVIKGRIEELAPRYVDFERRRESASGTFLRWDDLIKLGSHTLDDALRTVHGVHIVCDSQSFECQAAMARSPHCPPTWWVDGVKVRSFTETTPLLDIYGIEVYRGPAEVPGEFAGADAGCGVIAVWTKSKPYKTP